jgi:hypothetical protein
MALLAGTATAVQAQETEAEELARRSTDPTSSPLTMGLIGDITLGYRDLADGTPVDETGFDAKFQPVIPFKAWGAENIFRMTIPYEVAGPGPAGLQDVTLFNLVVLPQSWGRLGIGLDASLRPATSDVPAHLGIGPAIGAVIPLAPNLNVGLFNQNLFGNDLALTQVQPILAYLPGHGWSISLGDLQWVYDWHEGMFVSIPIGVQVGKVLPVAGQPMRFSVNPQFDLKDLPGNQRISLLLTVQLIVPQPKAAPAP